MPTSHSIRVTLSNTHTHTHDVTSSLAHSNRHTPSISTITHYLSPDRVSKEIYQCIPHTRHSHWPTKARWHAYSPSSTTPPGSAVKHVKRIPSGERNLTSDLCLWPIKGKPAHWSGRVIISRSGHSKRVCSRGGERERRFSRETECLQPAMLKESGCWCSTELYREAHVQNAT